MSTLNPEYSWGYAHGGSILHVWNYVRVEGKWRSVAACGNKRLVLNDLTLVHRFEKKYCAKCQKVIKANEPS